MTDEMTVTLIIAAVAVVVAGVGYYYLMRFMRGSIKLLMTRTSFSSGEDITGRFEVMAKKPLQGNRLVATLIGREIIKTYEDGKTNTRTRQIYKNEAVIEEARTYPPGFRESYEFVLPPPDLNELSFMKTPMGGALKTAMNLMGDRRTIIEWNVEIRLDAVGIDLAASKSVYINA